MRSNLPLIIIRDTKNNILVSFSILKTESETYIMQTVVNFINNIGNIGGLVGIGWAAWGAWDLAIGIRRELDDKKDKGIQSVILGALLGTVLKTLFSALAAGLQAIG